MLVNTTISFSKQFHSHDLESYLSFIFFVRAKFFIKTLTSLAQLTLFKYYNILLRYIFINNGKYLMLVELLIYTCQLSESSFVIRLVFICLSVCCYSFT